MDRPAAAGRAGQERRPLLGEALPLSLSLYYIYARALEGGQNRYSFHHFAIWFNFAHPLPARRSQSASVHVHQRLC